MKVQVALRRGLVVALLLTVGACNAGESNSTGKKGIGLKVSDEATAEDVGLPSYPGSKLFEEPGDSSSGANIGIESPLFGLKVAAVKLETADQPDEVAAFYRRALAKYGQVLDCSDPANGKGKSQSADEDELTCDAHETEEEGIVYKAGTEKNMRLVSIKPLGNGTQFNLVHVDVRD